MEINFNTGVNWAAAASRSTESQSVAATGAKTQEVRTERDKGVSEADILRGSEPTAEVPEAALRRDDDLGKLINSIFNMPAPPMPDFSKI